MSLYAIDYNTFYDNDSESGSGDESEDIDEEELDEEEEEAVAATPELSLLSADIRVPALRCMMQQVSEAEGARAPLSALGFSCLSDAPMADANNHMDTGLLFSIEEHVRVHVEGGHEGKRGEKDGCSTFLEFESAPGVPSSRVAKRLQEAGWTPVGAPANGTIMLTNGFCTHIRLRVDKEMADAVAAIDAEAAAKAAEAAAAEAAKAAAETEAAEKLAKEKEEKERKEKEAAAASAAAAASSAAAATAAAASKASQDDAASKSKATAADSGGTSTTSAHDMRDASHPTTGGLVLICAACNELIEDDYTLADTRYYHKEHFVCFQCHSPLKGNYFQRERGPQCPKCHAADLRCHECARVIDAGEKYVVRFGHRYHIPCMPKRRCTACKLDIDKEAVSAFEGTKFWHIECFTCTECSSLLDKEYYLDANNLPLCEKCYELDREEELERRAVAAGALPKAQRKCSRCTEQIEATDQHFIVESQLFHAKCLTCTQCNDALALPKGKTKELFMSDEKKLLCQKCHTSEQEAKAPKCGKCSKAIIGGKFMKIGDRMLHKQCFQCAQCNRALNAKSVFMNDDDELICEKCAQ